MVKLNSEMKAGTDAATVTDVQVNYVSQTIAKPNVISRCLSCKFWTKKTQYDWQTSGLCSELKGNDLITIDIKTGWDGGYVDEIETDPNFGCVCWVSNGL